MLQSPLCHRYCLTVKLLSLKRFWQQNNIRHCFHVIAPLWHARFKLSGWCEIVLYKGRTICCWVHSLSTHFWIWPSGEEKEETFHLQDSGVGRNGTLTQAVHLSGALLGPKVPSLSRILTCGIVDLFLKIGYVQSEALRIKTNSVFFYKIVTNMRLLFRNLEHGVV